MDQQQQFLYIVNITLMAEATHPKYKKEDVSASTFFMYATHALSCSRYIPEDMSAVDAANEFIGYVVHGEISCPEWIEYVASKQD